MTFGKLALALALATAIVSPAPVQAQAADIDTLRRELGEARTQLDEQARMIREQDARLRSIEAMLAQSAAPPPSPSGGASVPGDPAGIQQVGVEQVGEGPSEIEMPELAVLGDQGSAITRAGQLTGELYLEYARADRNRALFRGIELVESVLVGVFDINESRQDVLTAALGFRYGLTSRLEFGLRVPYVYRSDKMVLAPIAGSSGDPAATVDTSADGRSIGDVEYSARYQLTRARNGHPFFIANLQLVAPTGRSAFEVPRDADGRALKAATGAGFWGISPSLTAILPSDPGVLFGTLGYTHNFGRDVDTAIPPVMIERVEPGDALSASMGLGVSLNQETSFNLGYAHSWVFGTRTRTRLLEPGPDDAGPITTTSRDLQLGRFLFGVTHRISDRINLNWSTEIGATDDATDLRTVLRIPIVLLKGK